jgi:hypothetical protein
VDRTGRIVLEIASLVILAAFLFPPFQLGNGQPEWGFIGRPPAVNQWVTWDEVLANSFKAGQAGIAKPTAWAAFNRAISNARN